MGISREDVPQEVEEAIVLTHKNEDEGQQWLADALQKVHTLENDWDFTPIEVLGGENSLVIKVEEKDEEAVLKIPTDPKAGCDEIAALKIWEDCNVPVVKNEDSEGGVFMMDYVPPLPKEVNPFQAFVLADLIHTPAGNFDYTFPPLLNTVVQKLLVAHKVKGTDIGPATDDLELAVKVVETLLATQDHQELLHGDYRNHNIIYAKDGPVIIDPKPCMGDSLYDIASWLADSDNEDGVEVVEQLIGGAAERLIPWTWALSVIRERPAGESLSRITQNLKAKTIHWLNRQTSQ